MSTRRRVRLIAIGYDIAGTGLTRVMHSIMRRLADRHEIHYLGIGYAGDVVRDRGLTIYPTNRKGGDVFAAFQAIRLIDEIQPDLIFVLHDLWLFEYYLRLFAPFRDRLSIAAYIPLDGRITDEAHAAPLEHADRVIAYTRFAQAELEGAFRRLIARGVAPRFPAVDVIPHGTDADRFFPLAELTQAGYASEGRATAKRRVFPWAAHDAGDSFVVLNASRPDKRKRVDLTVKGFAQFAAGKPATVRLCLHHAILDQPTERDLRSLIQQCGIAERVSLNPLGTGVASDADLNLLYNACDVGISTSMGEGWGLVSCEHGGAGAPQIVPDHTACAELWRGRGELIPPVRSGVPEFSVLEMGEVSPDGVARALETLYRDPAGRQVLARAAVALARTPAHSWDAIARQFDDLFVALGRAGRNGVRLTHVRKRTPDVRSTTAESCGALSSSPARPPVPLVRV
jgi:D-inositol-3-phosphate glycosyltransferase